MNNGNVIISGGAGGIGSGISKRFVRDNYFVYILDIDQISGAKLEQEIGADKCKYVYADVTNLNTLINATKIDRIQNEGIRHIISLAGRALEEEWIDFKSQSLQTIENSIDLNLIGHIKLIHTFLHDLKRVDGDKSITLISSINALSGFGLPGYSASKAGMFGFVNAVAAEFGENGIRINTVAPGTVITAATKTEKKDLEKLLQGTLLGRFTTTEDVSELVFILATKITSITGQNIVVDCGQLIKE